jgi:hypothetical protein
LYRSGNYEPFIFRTRDYGKTWTKITNGLPVNEPGGSFVRVLRSDTKRRGLLFAGTESGVYASFDDGDHWQSLRTNAPTTAFRDIVFKDNDLIAATYGRGFWVLDGFTMLRELTPAIANEPAHLFQPGDAFRLRRNVGYNTPFPPEVPHAANPPEGVIVDYWLASAPAGDITLDVLDKSGALVRHMTSAPMAPVPEAARPPEPNFWIAPPKSLPKNAGSNRTNWNLRYDAPLALTHTFEINANPGATPPSPEGPVALPGVYTLRLTVNGRSYTKSVTVKGDPRSPATPAGLAAQHDLQMKIVQGLNASFEGNRIAAALRDALRGAIPAGAAPELSDAAARAVALAAQIDTVAGLDAPRRFGAPRVAPTSFRGINEAFTEQLETQENGDFAPAAAAVAAYASTCNALAKVAAAWQKLSTTELGAFNQTLIQRGRTAIALPTANLRIPTCK